MKRIFFSLVFMSSIGLQARADENSIGLQAARYLALHENTKNLPSRGYQLSARAVKNSRALQAINLPIDTKNSAPNSPEKQ